MNTISIIFFILILAFLPHQPLGEDGLALARLSGNELITQVCDQAEYKDLCLNVLKSAPESKDADLFKLTTIALKLAAANATDTRKHIQSLLKASQSESYEHECLTDCLENYDDAIDRIDESVEILQTKGYTDINAWVTAAMGDADSCEQGFHERPGQEALLTARNKIFDQLCSTVLTINKLLAREA